MDATTDIHFCTECHNLTTICIRETDQSLVHHCKACGLSDASDPKDHCLYTIIFKGRDMKHSLNQNQYMTHDVTLPKIKGNPHLKCLNPECASHAGPDTSSVTYVRYDDDQMKYLYICDSCGQSWTNE
jgi:DNA-directed RNA polymerase subunit M/transcription elongation factor TFIIS